MAMVKATLTLDESSLASLNRIAKRLNRPKSEVVRQAIDEFAARADRLDSEERERLLKVLDEIQSRPSPKTGEDVKAELTALRKARRQGWRDPR